jgi:hypothetical protein
MIQTIVPELIYNPQHLPALIVRRAAYDMLPLGLPVPSQRLRRA